MPGGEKSRSILGRPVPVVGSSQMLYGGMHRLQENVVINVKNKTHSVTAQIDIDAAAADQDHLIAPEERFRIAMVKQ